MRRAERRRFWKHTSPLCPKVQRTRRARTYTNLLALFPGVLAEKIQNLGKTRGVVVQAVLAQVPHKFPLRPMLEYLGDFPFRLPVSR